MSKWVNIHKRRQNQLNAKRLKELQLGFTLDKKNNGKPNRTRPLKPHINKVSTKISMYEQNLLVLKACGFTTRKTKLSKTLRRIERYQNPFYDGKTCKQRRYELRIELRRNVA